MTPLNVLAGVDVMFAVLVSRCFCLEGFFLLFFLYVLFWGSSRYCLYFPGKRSNLLFVFVSNYFGRVLFFLGGGGGWLCWFHVVVLQLLLVICRLFLFLFDFIVLYVCVMFFWNTSACFLVVLCCLIML